MLTLDAEQAELVKRVAAEPTRAALQASDRGTGKTLMAVELAKALGAQTVLLVCPLNTRDEWENRFTEQGVTLPQYRIDTKAKNKHELFEMLRTDQPGIYLVGREYFRLSGSDSKMPPCLVHDRSTCRKCPPRDLKRKKLWDWSKTHPDLIVYDEVHAAQNRNSTAFDVLKRVKGGFKLGQSGTFHGNKFQGAWAITRWLWPTVIDPSFWRWAAEHCIVVDDPHVTLDTGEMGKKVTVERIPGRFVNSLPCYVRIEGEDYPVITRNVKVDLSPVQRKQYTQMEESMVAWLGEHPLIAELPIVMRTRLRQMSLAEVAFMDDEAVGFAPDCKSSKLDALEKIITKFHPDDHMMIYTESQRFASVVAERIGAAEWSGKVSHKERERIKADFLAGRIKHIVATIASIGEGVDQLQSVCHTEVWLSESENNILNMQCQARLARRGQTETIYRYRVLARDTYDEGIMGNLLGQTLRMRASLRKGD